MTLKNTYKVPDGKMLKISLEKKDDYIKKITITGDFFAHPEDCIEKIENELAGKEMDETKLKQIIKKTIQSNNFRIFGFDEDSLAKAIIGCKK